MEKAKTFEQLLNEYGLAWNKAGIKGIEEYAQTKWVRLEDVEELEQKVKNLETDRDNLLKALHTCTQNLNSYAKESVELKQKLQQWMKEYEEICQDSETDYVRRCSFLEEKFEELLKE
jgi:chromosome segregation ATPase